MKYNILGNNCNAVQWNLNGKFWQLSSVAAIPTDNLSVDPYIYILILDGYDEASFTKKLRHDFEYLLRDLLVSFIAHVGAAMATEA
jgi:hypothetical protein